MTRFSPVRVLLDENLPHDLVRELPGHEVFTVHGLGWSGVKNGKLLRRMRGAFDALVSMDRNLEKQQALADQPFGTVIVLARSNRMLDLRPLLRARRKEHTSVTSVKRRSTAATGRWGGTSCSTGTCLRSASRVHARRMGAH